MSVLLKPGLMMTYLSRGSYDRIKAHKKKGYGITFYEGKTIPVENIIAIGDTKFTARQVSELVHSGRKLRGKPLGVTYPDGSGYNIKLTKFYWNYAEGKPVNNKDFNAASSMRTAIYKLRKKFPDKVIDYFLVYKPRKVAEASRMNGKLFFLFGEMTYGYEVAYNPDLDPDDIGAQIAANFIRRKVHERIAKHFDIPLKMAKGIIFIEVTRIVARKYGNKEAIKNGVLRGIGQIKNESA